MLTTSIECWWEGDETTWTMTAFQSHFTKADKEWHRKLTAQAAGYHGAHAATNPAAPPIIAPAPAANAPNPYSTRVGNCTLSSEGTETSFGRKI